MWSIALSSHELSSVVWRRLFTEVVTELPGVVAGLSSFYERLDRDRAAMSYKTGSIAFSSAIALYAIARKVNPVCSFEVGTFIGRSAAAIMTAMDAGKHEQALFQTCDMSNEFVMDVSRFKTRVKAMPRTGSTDALRMAAGGPPVDFFHIDGRLQPADLELMSNLAAPQAAIALDDFEGIEKGVANALLLSAGPKFGGYFLIEPPSPDVLEPLGLTDRTTTALLLPSNVFHLSRQ